MINDTGRERFENDADKYAAYLATPDGRLRLDLAFASIQEFLPQKTSSLRALDLGCGPGANGVRLARLGFHVTLLDASLPMLEHAKRAAEQAGVAERIALKHGDADQLTSLCDAGSFDLILCHNVLEFLSDPSTVLSNVGRAMRNSSSLLSVLVRNQPGEVLKAALVNGDLAAAERNLTAEWGDESLYGEKVRLFASERLRPLLKAASFEIIVERGVRVLSDYLPSFISRDNEYQRILALERKIGTRPEFAAIARYTQCLCHPTRSVTKDRA
jgi:S-adenosylmethionine-dependent methyltransferase